MSRGSFFGATTSDQRAVDDVIEQTNAGYTRLRHPREGPQNDEHECLHASHESVGYIRAFWPYVAGLIDADPRKLGLSVKAGEGRFESSEIKRTIIENLASDGDQRPARIMAGTMAPLTIMTRLLNEATGTWAEEFEGGGGQCPFSFELDPSRFVSLRTLFPRKEKGGAVGGNAPTLVMGGTATAVAMCWNLLFHLPRVYSELEKRDVDRETMERLWEQTRELIFRIGSGSLTAFVAFASACSSDASKMIWDGAQDLALARRDERYVWMMNRALLERYERMLSSVKNAQQGHFVGCAALFARCESLPLNAEFADEVATGRDPTVFSELVRWITAVARAEYFSEFDAAG